MSASVERVIKNRCNWCGKELNRTGVVIYCNDKCESAFEACASRNMAKV